jgi:hypothetical protein
MDPFLLSLSVLLDIVKESEQVQKLTKADKISKVFLEKYSVTQTIKCKVLLNKDHTTCGKEKHISPDHRTVTLGFRVKWLG